MFNWLKELLEIKATYRERNFELKVCESCETLKMQLAMVNSQNEKLIGRLLEKPEPDIRPNISETPQRTGPISWKVRREMLEREDRAKARVIRDAPIPTEDLEKELGIVEGKSAGNTT